MNLAAFARRAALLLGATAVLLLSGGLAWATVVDYGNRGIVPPGVTVAGTDLSGMTVAEARAAITRAVAGPVKRPIRLIADGRSFQFDPAGAVTIDTEAMLDEAMAPRRSAPLVARVRAEIADGVLPAQVAPRYVVAPAAMKAFIASVSKAVNRRAIDASITVEDGVLSMSHSKTGRRVDVAGAERAIQEAFAPDKVFSSGDRTVEASCAVLRPRVSDDQVGHTIIVSRSSKSLRLYDGEKLEKKYSCAVGTVQYPTPLGQWKIVDKQYMPAWYNPGSAWAAGMPKYIPPGPSNPLGTRALALDASGVLIHGTTKDYSIGTAASHGCIRMHMWDVENLFPRVEVGTKVYVIP